MEQRMKTREKGIPVVALNQNAEAFRAELFRMMARTEKRRQLHLRRDRAKRLGPVESLHMRLLGRADGMLGLPREQANHVCTSPLIQKELNAQQEYRERVWGAAQIDLEPFHMRCESLLTVIAAQNRKLEAAQGRFTVIDANALSARKRGEEALSNEQIAARRRRELDRENAKVRAEVLEIEQTAETYYEELSVIHCFIAESENTAKLTCERMMDHTRQRIDAYWRAAMKVHPSCAEMPALPMLSRECEAEAAYMDRHGRLNKTVILTLEQYRERKETTEINGEAA